MVLKQSVTLWIFKFENFGEIDKVVVETKKINFISLKGALHLIFSYFWLTLYVYSLIWAYRVVLAGD